MSSQTQFKFKVESFRKLPDPVQSTRTVRYFAFCDTAQLPTDLPMETNPREQNLKTKVAKKILAGFLDGGSQMFHLLNRGLLLSAESVDFDNQTGEVTISMADPLRHGLVDGGHTYKIVTDPENQKQLQNPQFVTLEIMTGIEDEFELIAGARNTSVQVKEKSLAELEGKLDVIKQLIAGKPFENDVAYVENEDKPIDVENVVALLTIFHNDVHGSSQPWFTYSVKSRNLQIYLQHEKSYLKLLPIASQIFKLHDLIKRTFPDTVKDLGGRPGALKEIGYKSGKPRWPLYFSSKQSGDFERIAYDVPGGFVYPILGALRFLVTTDPVTGKYDWLTDPVKFYKNVVGQKLVGLTLDASGELGRNPVAVGKSPRHWEGLYNYVAATFLTQKASSAA